MNLRRIQTGRLLHHALLCSLLLGLGCRSETAPGPVAANVPTDRYTTDELSIQHGMELFNRHCTSCHNFTAAEIGPNLSGVTSEVGKAWLIAYIHNPTATIQSGDARAVELFNRYKLYMPSFPQIQGDDMEHLLGFIHKFSEAEKRNTSARAGGLVNPIPEPVTESGLVLELEEWFTAPASAPAPPLARINKLDGFGGGKRERLFLADQRGALYEIKGDSVCTYLDLKQEEPGFIDSPGFGTGLGSFAFHPDFPKNGKLYTTHTEPALPCPTAFPPPCSGCSPNGGPMSRLAQVLRARGASCCGPTWSPRSTAFRK